MKIPIQDSHITVKIQTSQMRVRILSTSGNLFINAALNGKIPTNIYQTLPQFCKNVL